MQEEWISEQGLGLVKRLSMRRIIARRTKAGRYGRCWRILNEPARAKISLTDPESRAMAAQTKLASATTSRSRSTREEQNDRRAGRDQSVARTPRGLVWRRSQTRRSRALYRASEVRFSRRGVFSYGICFSKSVMMLSRARFLSSDLATRQGAQAVSVFRNISSRARVYSCHRE